jgi:outer membrane immunogenic protein
MKKILLLGCAFALCGAPVLAADLPTRPVYQPFPAPMFSWTGCYIGANVGGAWARAELYDSVTGTNLSNPNGSGWAAGGQFGCDVQIENTVFGFETMWDGSDAKGTRSDGFNGIGFSNTAKLRGFGTLTGRIGYAADHSLLYVKVGGAWAEASTQITGPLTSESHSTNGSGWVVGGGWEFAFAPNWSTKIEYNYMEFGNRSTTYAFIPETVQLQNRTVQTVLVGLNYRFGDWGKAPVVAKY